MSAQAYAPAVSIDLSWLEAGERRALSHSVVRGQITAASNFTAYPPSRGAEDTVRHDLQAVQAALDADAPAVELGPWHQDPDEGWRQLTMLVQALEHLASPEGHLVEQLRTRVVAATGWHLPEPTPQRTRGLLRR